MPESPNQRQSTIDTYNESADRLREYFRGIGPRENHIDLALELSESGPNPRIIEIGCGDGRDARAIAARTDSYLGFDISESMVQLAKDYVPNAEFVVADAAEFEFPDNIDIIFAFASVLHLDPEELNNLIQRATQALRPGGVFYISTKYRSAYAAEMKHDAYGSRLFHYYNEHIILDSAGSSFEVASLDHEYKGETEWLELALRKVGNSA